MAARSYPALMGIVIFNRDIHLNGILLFGLTEALTASVTLCLQNAEGEELAAVNHQVELLAHNEWGGVDSMAELLPALSCPMIRPSTG